MCFCRHKKSLVYKSDRSNLLDKSDQHRDNHLTLLYSYSRKNKREDNFTESYCATNIKPYVEFLKQARKAFFPCLSSKVILATDWFSNSHFCYIFPISFCYKAIPLTGHTE